MIPVAILGAGIGREHLAAYQALPDVFHVTAVVDQDGERIEEIRQGGTFQALESIDAALNDPEIHVIDICLPPHLHVPVTLRAFDGARDDRASAKRSP